MKTLVAVLFVTSTVSSVTVAEQNPIKLDEFLAQVDVSAKALEVLEDYRINGCEENVGVRGYRPNIDYEPVFRLVDDSYRRIELARSGAFAELIQTSKMQCGHLYLEYCGSGGCQSQIVFDDKVYKITGEPFLLVPEPAYESASANPLPAIIAWWGYGGSCHTQKDEETDPIRTIEPSSCLMTAQYDRQLNRIVFQHVFSPWPEGID